MLQSLVQENFLGLSHLVELFVVHLAVAGDVYDGVFLHCPFSHEMSWMRSRTSLSQFLRVSYLLLPLLICLLIKHM